MILKTIVILFITLLETAALYATSCPDAVNQLHGLNNGFRDLYGIRKKEVLDKLPVIIIAKGDALILYQSGIRNEVNYLPALYHRYKEISHIPLLLYLMINGETNLNEKKIQELHEFKKSIRSIQVTLEANFPIQEDISISEEILNLSLGFITNLIKEKINDNQTQIAFFRKLGPLLLKNAAQASFVQLDSLNTQIQIWKKQFSKEAWNRVAVVVMGPQMPRVGEVTMQYFARLTGKKMETPKEEVEWLRQAKPLASDPNKKNRRLVYAEGLKTEEEALSLLATHIIDEEIGSAFFDDELRMQCDLLSEGASKRLHEKCDKEENQ